MRQGKEKDVVVNVGEGGEEVSSRRSRRTVGTLPCKEHGTSNIQWKSAVERRARVTGAAQWSLAGAVKRSGEGVQEMRPEYWFDPYCSFDVG